MTTTQEQQQREATPVIIATPTYGGLCPPTVESIIASLDALREAGFAAEWRYTWGNAILWVARAQLASQAGFGGAVVCWADADVAWGVHDLFAVLRPVLEGRAELVAAPLAGRAISWTRVAAAAAAGVRDSAALERAAGTSLAGLDLSDEDRAAKRVRALRLGEGDLYASAAGVPFGLTAMAPDALTIAMRQTPTGSAQEAFAPIIVGRTGWTTGEDAVFVRRLRQGGGRVLVHLGSRVRHLSGPHVSHVAGLDEQLREDGWTVAVDDVEGGAEAEVQTEQTEEHTP